jgi:lysophospholipase L1-like esterase
MKKINTGLIIVLMLAAAVFAAGKAGIKSMELISRDAPAFAGPKVKTDKPAPYADNGNYNDAWRSRETPTDKFPVWIAYDLSGLPEAKREKALLVWYNEDTSPYDHTLITAVPNPGYNNAGAYTIEVNPAPGGPVPETGWTAVATVEKNTFHSRQHVFSMKGMNWVRLKATGSDGTKDNMDISFNMDIYDAGSGAEDDWLFIGDSITQMAMHHQDLACKAGSGSFSQLVNAVLPAYFPAQENGGTGYMQSSDGAKHINEWLSMFPGKYVGLSYGTNDAWNGMKPEEFYNNYKIMIEAVLKAGKVPLVPSIPWSSSQEKIQKNGVELNKQIVRLYKEYPKVKRGPDFWNYYKGKPELLSQDGVHPSGPDGLFAYRKLWAELALKKIYNIANTAGKSGN